jgi:hypothetical protein
MFSLKMIERLFPGTLLAEQIYGLVANDGKQPGPEWPFWIVGVACLMNGNQGFLDTVFDEIVVAEPAPQEPLYHAGQFLEQLPIIGLVTRLCAHHQR